MKSSISIKRAGLLLVFASVLLSVPVMAAIAETLSISQIDSSSLLLSQQVDLYLSLSDEEGNPVEGVKLGDLRVYESADGEDFEPVPAVESLAAKPNKEQGIHILLLIDNSGSMYDTLEGEATDDSAQMRSTHAKAAIRRFIDDSFNPKDVVSLSSFNTNLNIHSEALKDPSALDGLLEAIRRPESEEAYTELYRSLEESALDIAGYRGRKVVVVLSDGENYPYYAESGNPHPQYGTELVSSEEVVEAYQMEGITLYAVHFGIDKDQNLGDMAMETGGNVYDARSEDELAAIYRDIKEKIENEYRLTYRAGMLPAERKFVRVEYSGGKAAGEDTGPLAAAQRYYYAGTIFGVPVQPYPSLILLLTLLALLLWFLLLILRYRTQRKEAALEVLQKGYKTKVSSMTIALGQDKTVIGGGERADLTISGMSAVKPEHATIMHDKKTGAYTLVGEGNITVNNRKLSGNRTLSDGDVVNIEGTTIVFDAGQEKGKAGP